MAASIARVLIVDDSAFNRQLLSRLLAMEGYGVTTAENGHEAMARLNDTSESAIDVILLDILMPEMDGYEVLRILKADDRLRHLPIIVVSAVDEADSVIRCIEAGATDYLQKPFNSAILRARVAASLAQKRLRDTEIEYLREVGHIIDAAMALESGAFDAASLNSVAQREDALGNLARVFATMAAEVRERERRLQRQVADLRIEVNAAQRKEQVDQITGSDYFRDLRGQAASLRHLLHPEIGADPA